MDEFKKHFVEKKARHKTAHLFDSIYMNVYERQNREQISSFLELRQRVVTIK